MMAALIWLIWRTRSRRLTLRSKIVIWDRRGEKRWEMRGWETRGERDMMEG